MPDFIGQLGPAEIDYVNGKGLGGHKGRDSGSFAGEFQLRVARITQKSVVVGLRCAGAGSYNRLSYVGRNDSI